MKLRFHMFSFLMLMVSAVMLAHFLNSQDPNPSFLKSAIMFAYGFVWTGFFPVLEVVKDENNDSNN